MNAPAATAPAARVRDIIVLAWPMVLARATQAVIGFCDALMVAPLGKDALAATTTGAINSFSLVIFPMGLVFIVQTFSAQLTGRGDPTAARRYAWYGLIVAAATAVLSAVAIPFIPLALRPFGYTPAVRELMGQYLAIRMLSVGGVVATEALGNWYGGLGNTRLQMRAGILAMAVNVLGCWVLIQGRLGAPALGVAGSAWAAVIGSWSGFALLAVAFVRGRPRPAAPLGLRRSEMWRMLRFGVPNGLNWFLEFGAFAVFINVGMAHLGTTALAALNVVFQINSVSFMPAFGVASAGAIFVGQAVGARAPERVPAIVRLTATVAMTWMVTIGLSYLLAPRVLIGWFAPDGVDGDALSEVGAKLLMVSAAWQLFDGMSMTLSEALRAAGDTTWTMWARVVLAWVVFVPATMILVFVAHGGPVAAISCLAGYVALLAGSLYWRYRSGAWRRIDVLGDGGLQAI